MLDAFAELMQDVIVTRHASKTLVSGEWTDGASNAPETTQMVVLPMTRSIMKQMPEGQYVAEDKRFYAKVGATFVKGDRFNVNATIYEVQDISDREFEGEYICYYGKKIV